MKSNEIVPTDAELRESLRLLSKTTMKEAEKTIGRLTSLLEEQAACIERILAILDK